MKKIVIYVCSIIISVSLLTSCDSKPSNTSGAAASSETAHDSKAEMESTDDKTESFSAGSEASLKTEASSESEATSESGFSSKSEASPESDVSSKAAVIPEKKVFSYILPEGSTLESRFVVPDGYVRTEYPEGSFGSFVRNYPMKPDGSPVLLWTKEPKGNQRDHAAVFDMMVEDELDVQQCADSVMRIYAEYFRATG